MSPQWPASLKTEGSYQSFWAPLQQLNSRMSSAEFTCLGLNLSPLIGHRNLKTHIPAIPVNPPLSPNLHRIRGTQVKKFQVDDWATPRLEALIQKGQKDFLASGWVPVATVFLLPSGTPIYLQINRDALVDLVNYCLLCSHLHSWNLLNFSAHTGWFNYDPDWCNLLLFSY